MCLDNDTHPLDHLPDLVKRRFQAAGWQRGFSLARISRSWREWLTERGTTRPPMVNFAIRDEQWKQFALRFAPEDLNEVSTVEFLHRCTPARQIIQELWGRRITQEESSLAPNAFLGDFSGFQVTNDVLNEPDDVRKLGEMLGTLLIPIGQYNTLADLMISEHGHVLMFGATDYGTFYAGCSLGSAMERLLRGDRLRSLRFAGCEETVFRLPEYPPDRWSEELPPVEGARLRDLIASRQCCDREIFGSTEEPDSLDDL